MSYEILVAVDTDETRAERQADIVSDLPDGSRDVHVTVFHVFTKNPEGASVGQLESARLVRDRLEAEGLRVTLDESSGDPVEEIVDKADEIDANRICVAGRKRTPTGKVLFGSVAQGVILDADRPVLVCSVGD
jgi:nucleotide-binding universal stress UspA family protein